MWAQCGFNNTDQSDTHRYDPVECHRRADGSHAESCADCVNGFNLIERLRTKVRAEISPDTNAVQSRRLQPVPEVVMDDLEDVMYRLDKCKKNLYDYRAHVRAQRILCITVGLTSVSCLLLLLQLAIKRAESDFDGEARKTLEVWCMSVCGLTFDGVALQANCVELTCDWRMVLVLLV